MKKTGIFFLLLLSGVFLQAQTWTGATSTNWNTASNWSPAVVPTGTGNVTIPGVVASGNWPSFSGNVIINSINMQAGSQLDVNGSTLSLNGVNSYNYFTGATLNNSNAATDIVINIHTGIGGYISYFRSNTVNDHILFYITGNNQFNEGDAAPSNQYNGNATFNFNDVTPVYVSHNSLSQFKGNLTVNRTVAGSTTLFNAGASIAGDFLLTNDAGGGTGIGNASIKTNIAGKVNIACNYPSPATFEIINLSNQTTGGIINIQNTTGINLQKDTLKVSSLSITGYRTGAYAYMVNNDITGNVTVADDASYTGGYITWVRGNSITGNSSFTNYGTNQFIEADIAGQGNHYTGNTTFTGGGTGPLLICYGAKSQFDGNLTINRTAAGTTQAFYAGANINGNLTYTNNTAGNTYLGNIAARTSISGTVNISANYSTPNIFEMHRLVNQTTGGLINVQNSAGFNISKDTLLVNAFGLNGYKSGGYGYLVDNDITGTVTVAADASYGGGYITYVRGNLFTGTTTFMNNGTNQLNEADITGEGNHYVGNTTFAGGGSGGLYICYGAKSQFDGNLTISRATAGHTQAFAAGATINGNFTYTNSTAGNTYLGAVAARTSISGTVNISANYSTPNIFEMHRLVNQTNGGIINVQNSEVFRITRDTLLVNTFGITGYKNGNFPNYHAYLLNNDITGNLSVADHVSFLYNTYIRNNVFTGNTSFSNNGSGILYDADIAASGNKYIGNPSYTRNGGSISVGAGDFMEVSQNLTLNSTTGITLGKIKFNGGTNGSIEQLRTQPISIPTLVMEKNGAAKITLNDSVRVTGSATFINGNIFSSAGNHLIFPDNISYTGASLASHVVGPVSKIGNDVFTFPLGSPGSYNQVTMSAPTGITSRFSAEYINQNPTANGFNTDQKAGSFGTADISNAGYWDVKREIGTTNVNLTLGFAANPNEQYPAELSKFKVAHWNSTQWDDHGNGGTTGTSDNGTVVNGIPITSYSPFALAFPHIKLPVITIGNVKDTVCPGEVLPVPFTVDSIMAVGNGFIAELSDSTGSFASPVNMGSYPGTTSGTINAIIPNNISAGIIYRIRVVSTNPAVTSLNIKDVVGNKIPQKSFTISGATLICASNQSYSCNNTEAGVTYTWVLSGGGTITPTGSTAVVSWSTPGTYSLTLKTSNNCGNGPEQTIQVTVSAPAISPAPVINNIGRWLYASQAPVNANYNWYRNGSLIAGAVNNSYYASLAGDYTIQFSGYCIASPVSNTVSFSAASIPQTINFPVIPGKIYGDIPFNLNATSGSGLPVSFSIVSGPATINSQTNLLTITGAGLVIVKGYQLGNDAYDTAAPVLQNFTVSKALQVISFPAIANQNFGNPAVTLAAISSSGLPISYTVVSGPASVSGNILYLSGIGNIIVRASQSGNNNYLAASNVDTGFCSSVAALGPISGFANLCPASATYSVQNIPGATYVWKIAGGNTLPFTTNSATVNWTTPGRYTLLVSASGNCGVVSSIDTLVVTVINSILPDSVQSMYPVNGAANQQLPLTLSWVPAQPGSFYTFDLYVWRADLPQPLTPFAANITAVNYTLPISSGLAFNQTYKWMVVAHNGSCLQINSGPVQQFRLIPLPDLVTGNVQAPTTAFSGQTIAINWTVKNSGPGKTSTNQPWTDGVFLCFDSIPNFSLAPQTDPALWGQADFPSRPLLIGTRPNVSALDSGQQYTNSINFTLPVNFSLPLYAFVIANYPSKNTAPLQVTKTNDTSRAAQPIVITLSPTPDLRVDTVLTPTTTFSGSTISLSYKVKNYGVLTPVGAAWTDKVYISQSPLFNINTAIPLKFPKVNGSYYINEDGAAVRNTNQLLPDGAYTRNISVVVPNYIFGTYFIYVVANTGDTLYEGALNNNNLNRSQVQVFLTPTPHLTVSSLTLPITTASTTQPIGVNWNISNTGFNDNIEKNKGHYFVSNGPCSNPAGSQSIAVKDSLNFGSSFWLDRVYLSTNAGGLNTSTAILVNETIQGVVNSGLVVPDSLVTSFPCQPLGTNISQFNLNTSNVIKPNSNHPKTGNFTVPSDLPAGEYYVYVLTNATKTVFEYPGTPETRRSAMPIAIQRPDATVPALTVPATAIGGSSVAISYSVLNSGPGAVYKQLRSDKIYISNSPVFNGTAQLIATQTYTEDLPVGTAVPHSLNYTLPITASGNRYFYVHTNFDGAFSETNTKNNVSAAATMIVTAAAPNDLFVSNIQLADTVLTVSPTSIKYTVANSGTGSTSSTWTDSVFISCSPIFSPYTTYFVAKRSHSKMIPAAGSYTDSFTVNMKFSFYFNQCFPKKSIDTAYFFIQTNSDNAVYEGNNVDNNILGSGSRIIMNPSVDHIVTSVTGPDTATVGRQYLASWTVKNIGDNPGPGYYSAWYDAIYFSPDSIFNGNAVLAGSFGESTPLNTNQVYSDSKNVIPPKMPTGDYYVHANANYFPYHGIDHEIVLFNNTNVIRNGAGAAKKIHVIQPLLPDLTDSILLVPVSVAVGQPLTVVHRVSNEGAGVTYPPNWSDDIWLSADYVPGNAGDIRLSAQNHSGALEPNQYYNDTVTATLALNFTPGNYVLISRANNTGNVFESNNNNNHAFQYITVFSPAPADLIVENMMMPDTVFLGYTIDTAKWVIKNIAPNEANGISSDGIYLSKSRVLDSTAVLLGISNKTINMAPMAQEVISLQPMVKNVIEGNYNVIVKTDLLNNMVESDKNNNTGIAVSQVYVAVKELPLNMVMTNTLQSEGRYYKLIIPDSLSGATIQVVLKSGDSLTMKNQLFIGKGFVPSAAKFDYSYSTPNYGNQDIVMASVTAGVYYITANCVTTSPVVQNITLKAVKLPFAILNVQSSSGGNTGNVTIKISGSLFVNNMTATLSKPGITISSSAVYFTNSTIVYATFNLQGKPLGIFDISLTKPDNSVATLVNGFSVVAPNNGGLITGGGVNTGPGNGNEPGCAPGAASGLNSQLVVEIVAPDNVLVGWPFVLQINYNNPTNVDIPAQTRTLFSDHDVLMALTAQGVANGTTSLYLSLTEQNGPPGIIRAGGSGSIMVYSKMYATLPRNTLVLFNLK